MPKFSTVLVSSGALLKCRPVPPFAMAEVRGRMPEPPMPKVTVSSAAGGPEVHDALPSTPEYEAYKEAHQKYRRELGLALERFSYNYGIIEWSWPPEDPAPGEHVWVSEPPEDWRLPAILKEYGVEELKGPDRRAQYILYELLLTDVDTKKVERLLFPTELLTKEDILAALAPFGSSDGVDLSSILSRPLVE